MKIVKVARSVIVPVIAPLGLVAAGCALEDERAPTPQEELTEELQSRAESVLEGDEPYYFESCELYGDCVYCDGWEPNGSRCPIYCYGYACLSGDEGGDCYEDCTLSV